MKNSSASKRIHLLFGMNVNSQPFLNGDINILLLNFIMRPKINKKNRNIIFLSIHLNLYSKLNKSKFYKIYFIVQFIQWTKTILTLFNFYIVTNSDLLQHWYAWNDQKSKKIKRKWMRIQHRLNVSLKKWPKLIIVKMKYMIR